MPLLEAPKGIVNKEKANAIYSSILFAGWALKMIESACDLGETEPYLTCPCCVKGAGLVQSRALSRTGYISIAPPVP